MKLSKEFNSFFPDLIDMQLNSPCKDPYIIQQTGNKNINLILPVRSISYSQTSDENIETVEVVILIKHQILVRNLQGIVQQPKEKIINHFGI